MEITELRVRKAYGEKNANVKAFVTITFDNCFAVHNIKIFEGKSGLAVAMPNRRVKIGIYKDVAHPITSEFRNKLKQIILDKYAEVSADNQTKDNREKYGL